MQPPGWVHLPPLPLRQSCPMWPVTEPGFTARHFPANGGAVTGILQAGFSPSWRRRAREARLGSGHDTRDVNWSAPRPRGCDFWAGGKWGLSTCALPCALHGAQVAYPLSLLPQQCQFKGRSPLPSATSAAWDTVGPQLVIVSEWVNTRVLYCAVFLIF